LKIPIQSNTSKLQFQERGKIVAMSILESIRQFADVITIADAILLTGLILLITWLIKAVLYADPLADSVPRRNSMPLYVPFITLLVWLSAISLTIPLTNRIPALSAWQSTFASYAIISTAALAIIAVIILLVKAHFARGLKGFGLDPGAIPKDCLAAVLNLIYIWPIVYLATHVTVFYGQLIFKQDFNWPQHETLELVTSHPQLPLRILIIVTTAAIVPVLEEMVFRGLFQTAMRSFLQKTWPSIILTAALFAVVHQYKQHWPALFVLAICLGYSYEKSGSLFRPILIHSIFNAASITFALYGA
jgi:membrane protease YdiL (CAAX protease family)